MSQRTVRTFVVWVAGAILATTIVLAQSTWYAEDDAPEDLRLLPSVISESSEDGADCNTNGVEDGLDITGGTSEDCNTTAVPDECDIAGGTSFDANTDGIPDECDVEICVSPWDGFQPNPPFGFQTPLSGSGDGHSWCIRG